MQPEPGEDLFAQLRGRIAPVLRAASTADMPQSQSIHPPDQLLEALQHDWLPKDLRDDLRAHLVACPSCRTRFADQHLQQSQVDQASEPALATSIDSMDSIDSIDSIESAAAPSIGVPDIVFVEEPVALAPETAPSLRSWGPSAALIPMGLLLLLLLPVGPNTISPKVPSTHKGFSGRKGHGSWTKGIEKLYADFANRTLLHLGVADGLGKPVRRLHRDAECLSRQSLFFGFSLASPGGYAYLFRIDPKGQAMPELLFPFVPSQARYEAGGSVHVIQQKGVTQRYPLQQEGDDVLFVLIQRSTPLSLREQSALLQQKTGWGAAMQVVSIAGIQASFSFDRFLVRIPQHRVPGETP